MLECWMTRPEDRPTFSQLRSKFSNLLMATSDDAYIVLEVDENKPYYTMGGEEEEEFNKERRNSLTSDIRVATPNKMLRHRTNTYVDNPSVDTKLNRISIEDESNEVNIIGGLSDAITPVKEEIALVHLEEEQVLTMAAPREDITLHTMIRSPASPSASPILLEVQASSPPLPGQELGYVNAYGSLNHLLHEDFGGWHHKRLMHH